VNTAWTLVTGPTTEPIAVDEAKDHLRVKVADEDAVIARLVKGARGQAEEYLGRGLVSQAWKYTQDVWTDEMRLPRAPLKSVTSVKYYDAAGVLQTLSPTAYVMDTVAEPGVVRRAPNQVWPTLQSDRLAAVEIAYVVGYASVAAIPPAIVHAVYLLLGTWYEHRESVVTGTIQVPLVHGVEALLAPHRVFWYPPKDCQ
jgi:uncharacterized phiE125 gp8 family phage protein